MDRSDEPQESFYDQALKLVTFWRETALPAYPRWADIVEEALDQRWLEGFEAGLEAAEA